MELEAVTIHAMTGDGIATKVNEFHNISPIRSFPSVCFIDGDSRQEDSADKRIYRLPGEGPETHIYHRVLDRIDVCSAKLAVAMQLPAEMQSKVTEVIRSVANTNHDPHVIFSQVGEKLGLISEHVIQGAFLAMWAQLYPEEVNQILEPLKDLIPKA